MNKKISFVSPCYNEESNVYPFYNLVKETMKGKKYDYEIVFVNDGSKDNTMNELEGIYESDPKHIVVVNFLHNFGKEAALLAGLKNATGDYICTIDSDLQQDPKYGIQMADILENNASIDMVAAKPSNEKDSALLSFFKKSFYKIINAISSVPFYQGVSDFRVFRKNVCDTIISMPEHNRFSKGIFSWVCPDIQCIDYEVKDRASGTTKWSFFKLFKYAFEGICSFSHTPLLFPIIFGILELIFAVIFGTITIIGHIAHFAMPFSVLWILFTILILTGIQSISTGIIGQYLAKIHTETTNRPIYVIKEILKGEK